VSDNKLQFPINYYKKSDGEKVEIGFAEFNQDTGDVETVVDTLEVADWFSEVEGPMVLELRRLPFKDDIHQVDFEVVATFPPEENDASPVVNEIQKGVKEIES